MIDLNKLGSGKKLIYQLLSKTGTKKIAPKINKNCLPPTNQPKRSSK